MEGGDQERNRREEDLSIDYLTSQGIPGLRTVQWILGSFLQERGQSVSVSQLGEEEGEPVKIFLESPRSFNETQRPIASGRGPVEECQVKERQRRKKDLIIYFHADLIFLIWNIK
jgi:hypothetical protein